MKDSQLNKDYILKVATGKHFIYYTFLCNHHPPWVKHNIFEASFLKTSLPVRYSIEIVNHKYDFYWHLKIEKYSHTLEELLNKGLNSSLFSLPTALFYDERLQWERCHFGTGKTSSRYVKDLNLTTVVDVVLLLSFFQWDDDDDFFFISAPRGTDQFLRPTAQEWQFSRGLRDSRCIIISLGDTSDSFFFSALSYCCELLSYCGHNLSESQLAYRITPEQNYLIFFCDCKQILPKICLWDNSRHCCRMDRRKHT